MGSNKHKNREAASTKASQHPSFDAAKAIEGLRATRDVGVNLAALQALQYALRGHDALANLVWLLSISPGLPELVGVWDAQLKSRHAQSLTTLLTAIASLLHVVRIHTASQGSSGSAVSSAPSSSNASRSQPTDEDEAGDAQMTAGAVGGKRKHGINAAAAPGQPQASASQMAVLISTADNLARHIISSKMRSVYFCLSADDRQLANAALSVLAALASLSPTWAADLLAALDTQLAALYTLAKPPRSTTQDGAPIPKAQLWRQWRAYNPLTRPSRSYVIDLVLALMASADEGLLTSKLLTGKTAGQTGAAGGGGGGGQAAGRTLVGALLTHCAADPPHKSLQLLKLLAVRVLGPDSHISPAVRAGLWGDFALSQLVTLAAEAEDEATATAGTQGDTQAEAVQSLAGKAAAEVLLCVMTDPTQGLVQPPLPLDTPLVLGGAGVARSRGTEGVKRVLRTLAKLRPAVHPLHAAVLQGVAGRQPTLAAEFLGTVHLALDPVANSLWVSQCTLLHTLVTHIPAASPSQLVHRLEAAASAMQRMAATSVVRPSQPGAQVSDLDLSLMSPPGVESAQVRQALRRCLPAALSKLTTLKALSACLTALRPIITSASQAAIAATQLVSQSCDAHQATDPQAAEESSGPGTSSTAQHDRSLATAWSSFLRRLRASIRSRLPELQPLLVLAPGAAAEGQAGGKARAAAAVVTAEHEEDVAVPSEHQESGAGQEDSAGELEQVVFSQGKGVTSQGGVSDGVKRDMLAQATLEVLTSLAELLPDLVQAAHVDPYKLLPPGATSGAAGAPHNKAAAAAAARVEVEGPSQVPIMSTGRQRAWLHLVQAMQPAHTGRSSQGQGGQVSSAQLLPLLRMCTTAEAPDIRAAASKLLFRHLQRSGIFTAAATSASHVAPSVQPPSALSDGCEALVWIWHLPSAPYCTAAPGSAPHTPHQQLASGVISGAPATFLSDALVTTARRPHEAFALLQEALHVMCDAAGGQSGPYPSPLLVVALRSCLRACKASSKTSATDKAAIATYVAGVLHHLGLLMAGHTLPLLSVLHHMLAAEWPTTTPPEVDQKAGQLSITIPTQAAAIASIYTWLYDRVCQQSGDDGSQGTRGTVKAKGGSKGTVKAKGGSRGSRRLPPALSLQLTQPAAGVIPVEEVLPAVRSAMIALTHDTGSTAGPSAVQQAQQDVMYAMAVRPARDAAHLAQAVLQAVMDEVTHQQGGSTSNGVSSSSSKKKRKKQKQEPQGDNHVEQQSGLMACMSLFVLDLLSHPLQAHCLQLSDLVASISTPDAGPAAATYMPLLQALPQAWWAAVGSTTPGHGHTPSHCLTVDGPSALQAALLHFQLHKSDAVHVAVAGNLFLTQVCSVLEPHASVLVAAAAASCLHQPHLALSTSVLSSHPAGSPGSTNTADRVSQQAINVPAARPLLTTCAAGAADTTALLDHQPRLTALAQACLDPHTSLHGDNVTWDVHTAGSAPSQQAGSVVSVKSHLLARLTPLLSAGLSAVVQQLTTCAQARSTTQLQQAALSALGSLAGVGCCLPRQQLKEAVLKLLCVQGAEGTHTAAQLASAVQLSVAAHEVSIAPGGEATQTLSAGDRQLMQATQQAVVQLVDQCMQATAGDLTIQQTLALRDAVLQSVHQHVAQLLQYNSSTTTEHVLDLVDAGLLSTCLLMPTSKSSQHLASLIISLPHLQHPLTAGLYAVLVFGSGPDAQHNLAIQAATSSTIQALTERLYQHTAQRFSAYSAAQDALSHKQRLAVTLPLASLLCGCSNTSSTQGGQAVAEQHVSLPLTSQLLQLLREPLMAYAQRKRRKAAAQAAPGGAAQAAPGSDAAAQHNRTASTTLDAQVAAALHAHAIPVLCKCLSEQPLDAAALSKVWPRLVPASGGWSLEPWLSSPEAGPGQQASLAAHLVTWLRDDEVGQQQEGGLTHLQCLLALSRACITTLITCCKSSSKHRSSDEADVVQLVEQEVGWVLDGRVGDEVAGLSSEARGTQAFGELCDVAATFLAATLQYRPEDAHSVRRVRRFLAALMPDPSEGEEESDESEGDAMSEGSEDNLEDTAAGQEQGTAAGGSQGSDMSDGDVGECEMSDDEVSQGSGDASGSDSEVMSSEGVGGEQEDSMVDGGVTGEVDGDDDEEMVMDEGDAADVSADEDGDECDDEDDVEEEAAAGAGQGAGQAAAELQAALQQPALPAVPVVVNSHVSEVASSMLGALVSHGGFRRSVTTGLPAAPALPPHVAALPVPCSTLAPYLCLQPPVVTLTSRVASDTAAARPSPSSLRAEYMMLLEGLLSLRRTYQPAASPGISDDDSDRDAPAAGQGSPPAWPTHPREVTALRELMRLLLPTYQATMCEEDRLCLQLLFLLCSLIAAYDARDAGIDVMRVWLTGPLADLGYLWGSAHAGELLQGSATEQQGDEHVAAVSKHVAALREQLGQLEVRRVALACVVFPQELSSTVEEADRGTAGLLPQCAAGVTQLQLSRLSPGLQPSTGAAAQHRSADTTFLSTAQLPPGSGDHATSLRAAAADPTWLLPFTISALRQTQLPVHLLVRAGLMSLCLRALAAPDVPLRALAYEALGLFTARLEGAGADTQEDAPQQSADHSAVSQGVRRHPDDFRERSQVLALLHQVRNTLSQPLQCLPTCVAVMAAESAALLSNVTLAPAPALKAARRSLLASESLHTTKVPAALSRALASGTPTARVEQAWGVALLLAGLHSAEDVSLYRRHFIPQQLMTLVHSGCAAEDMAAVAGSGGLGHTQLPWGAPQLQCLDNKQLPTLH